MELTGWTLDEEEIEEIDRAGKEVPYRHFGWGPFRKVYESVFD
jgi:hypothetical protein